MGFGGGGGFGWLTPPPEGTKFGLAKILPDANTKKLVTTKLNANNFFMAPPYSVHPAVSAARVFTNAVLYTLKYKKVHKNHALEIKRLSNALKSKAHSVTGATLNARDFQALHLKAENQRAEECKIKQHKELQVH